MGILKQNEPDKNSEFNRHNPTIYELLCSCGRTFYDFSPLAAWCGMCDIERHLSELSKYFTDNRPMYTDS